MSLPRKLLASLATMGLVAVAIFGAFDNSDDPFSPTVIAHVE